MVRSPVVRSVLFHRIYYNFLQRIQLVRDQRLHQKGSATGLIKISYILGDFLVTIPGVMIEQGMLGKNGAARSITPGNEVV